MRLRLRGCFGLVVLVATVGVGPAGGGGSLLAGFGSKVRVTEEEFQLSVDRAKVRAGDVTVQVSNNGKLVHELVAIRTDLDEAALPITADGSKVDETGPGITHMDPEAEDVTPGSTKTVTIKLDPGRYVLICNLPGHYSSGMHIVVNARAGVVRRFLDEGAVRVPAGRSRGPAPSLSAAQAA